jgi:peroxiredoxin family protein
MNTMAMIITTDSFDKALAPLSFGLLGAATYESVDLLFVNWGAVLMTEEGLRNAKSGADHPHAEEQIKERLRSEGVPDDLYEIIKELKKLGNVHFYLCSLAAKVFGVTEENAIPELDSIVGSTWFLTEKAEKAALFMQY